MGIIGDINGAINDLKNARKPPHLSSSTASSTATAGDYIYISYTQYSRLQDIRFQYCYGDTSIETNWKKIALGANASGSGNKYWQIPYDVAEGNPNGRNVEVYVRIKAYYEGDDIGAEGGSTGSGVSKIDVYIPYDVEDYKPIITGWDYSTVNDSIGNNGERFRNEIIQNISKVKIRVWADAKYGASITKCLVMISPHDGIDGTYSTNALRDDDMHQPYFEIETGRLKSYQNINVDVKLTDSRGSTSNYIHLGQITVYSYQSPKIVPAIGEQEVICYRCDNGGAASDNGNRFYIKCRRECSPIFSAMSDLRNNSILKYRYKKLGDSAFQWGDYIPLLHSASPAAEYANIAPFNGNEVLLESDAEYQVEIHLVDDIGNEDTFTVGLSNMPPTLHLGSGGLSIGVGMLAKNGGKRIDIDGTWSIYHNDKKVKITYDT